MDGTDAGTGQHGYGKLGNHLHVHADSIALFHADVFQHIGKFLNFIQQLLIGKVFIFFRIISFPDEGSTIAFTGFHMAVQAIVAHIELTAFKPFYFRFCKINITDFIPFFEPSYAFGNVRPEGIFILGGTVINFLELVHVFDVGLIRKFRGWCKYFIRHCVISIKI